MTNEESNDGESSLAVAGRTQSERSAASSRAMLDAAVELIVQKGSRASMMEVGRASGFSHGLVLARFGSKTGLVEAVIRHVQLGFTSLVDRGSGGKGGLARLTAIVDTFFDTSARPSSAQHCFYVLMGEAAGTDSHFREHFVKADQQLRSFVKRAIEEAIEGGEIKPEVSPVAMSALLTGMLRGASTQLLLDRNAFDVEDARAQVHFVLRSLSETKS